MSLFSTKLLYSEHEDSPFRRPHSVMITYTPSCNGTKQDPRSFPQSDRSDSKTLLVPLTPATEDLEIFEVNMHGTKTKAYLMPAEISSWFSGWFGYDVKLAYIGKNSRGVLGSLDPGLNKSSHGQALAGSVDLSANILYSKEPVKISFADCAEYLVVTEQSLQDASSRLPDGEDMDITKFRPNIVVSDDKILAWDEDFWGAISVTSDDRKRSPQCDKRRIQIEFTANCVRCASLNVDYTTGAMGKGASGQILKRLKADRVVDRGATFSPVFGRYGFLKEGLGDIIKVGSEVSIEGFNKERDAFGKSAYEFHLHTRKSYRVSGVT